LLLALALVAQGGLGLGLGLGLSVVIGSLIWVCDVWRVGLGCEDEFEDFEGVGVLC
jgi:hypothetical protein